VSFTIDITEAEFQKQVTRIAEDFGWEWMHIGRTGKHVPNGAKGTLGPGWPDLLMVRGDQLLVAELKTDRAPTPTVAQQHVLMVLGNVARTYVWRPSQLALILEVLR
jgi:hypothetical protein